ncbi:MAG: hypothetical protein CMB16_01240 [Euryarchaeota archaeon]|nr:hypothetical protein [Euryarchaeota archaeon]|tara:strand:- start:2117 stop:2320 length:204 start_codon:yes stop_codon:yes gene_type:complete
MAIRVAWDRNPVSVHGSKGDLEKIISHLRNKHNFRKHSLIMPDRENDEEAVFFLYSACDPRWIMEAL